MIPRHPSEPARGGLVAFHRVHDPVGMAALQVALDALRAELALVEREVVPGFEADHFVVVHLQLDAALLTAEAAVRVDDTIHLDPGVPPSGWRLVEVRAVAVDQLGLGDRWTCHQPNPPTRADCANAS